MKLESQVVTASEPFKTDRAAHLVQAAMVLSGLDRAPGTLDGFALWHPVGQQVCLRSDASEHVVRLSVTAPGEVDLSVGDDIVQVRHGACGWRYEGKRHGRVSRTAFR